MSWSLTVDGAVGTIAYANLPENRIPFSGLRDLADVLTSLAADEAVKLVVLRSGVPGCFSMGAALDDIQAMMAGKAPSAPFRTWTDTLLQLENLPQPTIAMIDGQAASGGCEIALACTFRVGTRNASFVFREISRGAIPGAGATQRLPRLIGMARAAEIILTSRPVDAEEACRIGLIEAIVPDGDAALDQWLGAMSAMPRAGLVAAKQAIMASRTLPLQAGLELEQDLFLQLVCPPPQ